MRINKFGLVIGFAIATVLFLEVAAHADEQNQFTTFTFNKPVEIPGQILPAGTYLFKLADPDDMNLVRIFNAKGTRVYATLQTIPTERRESTGDTVVVMAEQGAGRPEALLKWFYPGRNTGNQFVYPKHEEQQLAQDRHRTILTKETAEAGD
jgi:hypothetical protein